MRLVAITFPDFWLGEVEAVRYLLDGNFWRVHIRKPGASKEKIERLLDSIGVDYYSRLSLHDCFEIASERKISGVHLNSRNPMAPADFKGLISRSCHSLEELPSSMKFDYQFISPVFDSISKPGYRSKFSPDQLKVTPLNHFNAFALGGVTFASLQELEDMGFPGCAMMSEAWREFRSK